MKRSDVFPSKYLKAEDLSGQTVAVTIETVCMEEVSNDQKAIAYFRGKQKGLVLNQINWDTIEAMYGDDTEGWTGKRISVFPSTTQFNGKVVACLRIKPGQSLPVAKAEAFIEEIKPDPSQGEVPADDIPF